MIELLRRLPAGSDWLLLLLVLGAIWAGSSIPPSDFPDARIFDYDKLLHICEYLVLGCALALLVLRRESLLKKAYWPLFLFIPGTLWALSDEIHQAYVGRDCSARDLLADLAGLTLAVIALGFLRKRETHGSGKL